MGSVFLMYILKNLPVWDLYLTMKLSAANPSTTKISKISTVTLFAIIVFLKPF